MNDEMTTPEPTANEPSFIETERLRFMAHLEEQEEDQALRAEVQRLASEVDRLHGVVVELAEVVVALARGRR